MNVAAERHFVVIVLISSLNPEPAVDRKKLLKIQKFHYEQHEFTEKITSINQITNNHNTEKMLTKTSV